MKPAEKEKLFAIVLGKKPPKIDERVWREFVDMAYGESQILERLFDEFVKDRELELRRETSCGHRIVDQINFDIAPATLGKVNNLFLIDANKIEAKCIACMRENVLLRALIEVAKINTLDAQVKPWIRKIAAHAVQELKALRAA